MEAPQPHLGIPAWFLLSIFKLYVGIQKNPAEGLGVDTMIEMRRSGCFQTEPPFKVIITFYPTLRSMVSSLLVEPGANLGAHLLLGVVPVPFLQRQVPQLRRAGDCSAPTGPSPPRRGSVYLAKFKPPPPPSQFDPLAGGLATGLADPAAFPDFFAPAVAVGSFCAA